MNSGDFKSGSYYELILRKILLSSSDISGVTLGMEEVLIGSPVLLFEFAIANSSVIFWLNLAIISLWVNGDGTFWT